MLIFLDTEFADFNDPDLISIGLVDENGREFYAELTDYRNEVCSDFVREVVLPLLKQHKNTVTGNQFTVGKELNEWFKFYGDEVVTICYDYNLDFYLMADLLKLMPKEEMFSNIRSVNIWGDLDPQAMDYYWAEVDAFGHKQHHALYDARGNKYAYKPLVRERNGKED